MFKENDKIGQYKLVRRLGVGGFGEVWLAKKRSLFITKEVAIKLPLEHQIDLDAIGKEAALWEQASGHPNVLPIIDADIYDGQVAIVSEYVDGGSLHDKLKQEGKLSLKNCVQMTIGILKGLEYLHNKGIIHRDLKPQNILLQGDTPRIADFGISRAVTSSTQNVAGTPSYMAPEAFDGHRNIQTDIWAVSVIIYRMLFGELPFPQKDMPSLIKAIIFEDVNVFPSDIPATLWVMIEKALAKNPDERFQTVSEMLGILQSPIADFEMMVYREGEKKAAEKLKEKVIDRNKKPRLQHYFFAYEFLREKAFYAPKNFVETLFRMGSRRLSHDWMQSALIHKPAEDDFILADGLESIPFHFDKSRYGVLIRLPEPERSGEAYFVVVLLDEKEESSDIKYRYVTLELGINSDGTAKTVIGEWTGPNGLSRKNYGSGPEPNPEIFLEELQKLFNI